MYIFMLIQISTFTIFIRPTPTATEIFEELRIVLDDQCLSLTTFFNSISVLNRAVKKLKPMNMLVDIKKKLLKKTLKQCIEMKFGLQKLTYDQKFFRVQDSITFAIKYKNFVIIIL